MALPHGFNPNNMSFGFTSKVTPVINAPRNTHTYQHRANRRTSLWTRFNNNVAKIGNWISDNFKDILEWFCFIAGTGIVGGALLIIIVLWLEDGFGKAMSIAIDVCIYSITLAIVSFIGINVILYLLRFIFWNGWTLIISTLIAIWVWLYVPDYINHIFRNKPIRTEQVAPITQAYQCHTPNFL